MYAYQGYGLGDICGQNPCGAWDWIYTTDSCLNYLQCSNPNDPRVIAMNTSTTQGVATLIGQSVGSATVGATSGLVSGLLNPDGSLTSTLIVGLVIGGIALVLLERH